MPAFNHKGPTKGNLLPCMVCTPGERMGQDMAMDGHLSRDSREATTLNTRRHMSCSRDIKAGSKKGSRDESSLWEIYIYLQIYAPSQHVFDHSHADFVANRKVGHYSSIAYKCSPTIIKTLSLVSQLNPWKPCLAQELSNRKRRSFFHFSPNSNILFKMHLFGAGE